MADYSRSPEEVLRANQQKDYVGLRFQQGVPLLDRDLNLLHDLIATTVQSVIARYIGDGVPANADGFAIQALPAGSNVNDFLIAKGTIGPTGVMMVGGIEATIPADIKFTEQQPQKDQKPLAKLLAPADGQPRVDIVYLDVFLTEVDANGETDQNLDLANSRDVGMATSVRVKRNWIVRVAEGAPVPAPDQGHTFYPLARLTRRPKVDTIEPDMIKDLRRSRLTMADMEARLAKMERLLVAPAFSESDPQFLPMSGKIGQEIRLLGTKFNLDDIKVMFDSKAAANVRVISANEIRAEVPAGLTPEGKPVAVWLTVSNPEGSDTSVKQFGVLAAPALDPLGRQFTPSEGVPGQKVEIHGFNFNHPDGVKVTFNTTPVTTILQTTNTRLVVEVPAGLVPAASVKITVRTTAGEVTSDDPFTPR